MKAAEQVVPVSFYVSARKRPYVEALAQDFIVRFQQMASCKLTLEQAGELRSMLADTLLAERASEVMMSRNLCEALVRKNTRVGGAGVLQLQEMRGLFEQRGKEMLQEISREMVRPTTREGL